MDANQEQQTLKEVLDKESIVAAEDAQPSVVQAPALTQAASEGPAPDTYAVAIHVMKMAPAWLLSVAVFFVLLIIVLSWMRPDITASGKDYPVLDDSKVSAADSAALAAPVSPKDEKQAAEGMTVSEEAASSPAPAELASSPTVSPAQSQPVVVSNTEMSVAAAPPAKNADAASDSKPKFTVQVGSHRNESSSNEQVSRLRSAGFDARAVVVELPGRGKWYRVQAGSFEDRAEASKDAALMRAKGVASAVMVVPMQ